MRGIQLARSEHIWSRASSKLESLAELWDVLSYCEDRHAAKAGGKAVEEFGGPVAVFGAFFALFFVFLSPLSATSCLKTLFREGSVLICGPLSAHPIRQRGTSCEIPLASLAK